MPPTQLSLDDLLAASGTARKTAGMALADANTDAEWAEVCDAAIERLAATGAEFQAADLADLGVPNPDHPNRWGPRLSHAARRGLITAVGYAPSKRPTTAKSAVRTWRGAIPAPRKDQP